MFAELLRKRVKGIAELSGAQIEALEAHYQLMLRWNRTVNLTRITRVEEAVERHYVESLFLGAHLPPGRLRIVDMGSGAGFPGFPVAILRPECEVTLLEAHARKAVFLREACRGVANIRVLSKRAGDVKNGFDWLISRAVSYEDLTPVVASLAPRLALLTGAESPPPEWGIEWQEPIRVPSGTSRFLRIGSVRN